MAIEEPQRICEAFLTTISQERDNTRLRRARELQAEMAIELLLQEWCLLDQERTGRSPSSRVLWIPSQETWKAARSSRTYTQCHKDGDGDGRWARLSAMSNIP